MPTCAGCDKQFIARRTAKYCSERCRSRLRRKASPTFGRQSTEVQYARIHNSWESYFMTLASKSSRPHLSADDLLFTAKKQKYRCALSGVPMTCYKEVGLRARTNASVDRILAGGDYTPDNIQLVCAALNSWRGDVTVEEFIAWCSTVSDYWREGEHD